MDSFYSDKTGLDPSRNDSALSMSRAMRSMNHHKLGDRTSCISPINEMDSKLRTPQRRRVPVAVCTPTLHPLPSKLLGLPLTPIFSVVDVVDERSSAAEILAMARAALTAGVLEIQTASSYEYVSPSFHSKGMHGWMPLLLLGQAELT